MNREHVLAVILVLSLCANAYLLITDHSSPNPEVQNFFSTIIPGAAHSMNGTPDSSILTESPQGNPDQGTANQTNRVNITDDEDPDMLVTATTPFVTPGTVVPTPTPDGWTTYTSKKYAFSVRYPTTWDLNDGSTGSPGRLLVLTAPPETDCDLVSSQCFKYIATMTIEIDQDPATLSLEEYFNSAVASLQKDYAITSTSRSASCMLPGNVRAYQIEFYTRDERGNPDRSYMQYYTLIDKKGYIISYTGPYSTWENVFAINKGDAQRIIDSFEVQRTYEVI